MEINCVRVCVRIRAYICVCVCDRDLGKEKRASICESVHRKHCQCVFLDLLL